MEGGAEGGRAACPSEGSAPVPGGQEGTRTPCGQRAGPVPADSHSRHRRAIPIGPLLRFRFLRLHRNVSLCSICRELANRRRPLHGTHSFAAWCFLESRILHRVTLNLGSSAPRSGADVLGADGHRASRGGGRGRLHFGQLITHLQGRSLKASNEVIRRSRAHMGPRRPPASAGFRVALRSGGGWGEIWLCSVFIGASGCPGSVCSPRETGAWHWGPGPLGQARSQWHGDWTLRTKAHARDCSRAPERS